MKSTLHALLLALLTGWPCLAGPQAGDWPYYGGDAGSTKFSPLDQIDRDNFGQLKVIWRWRPPDQQIIAREGIESNYFRSTPVAVGGVLYTSTPLGLVCALDAATGVQLWSFDPEAWKDRGAYATMHRGVAYWSGGGQERIFFGTSTDYLYALDARTGRPDSSFGEGGRVELTKGLRREVPGDLYALISPPIVCGDVIVVGSSIDDMRGRPTPRPMPPGDVRGFDARTGKQLWVFQTIPQQGEYGNETWGADSWKDFGAANVWSMMSADSELGYVYLPVSTPSNDFYGGERPGDNLFGDSIVCLDARTGKRVWHFQLTHHGLWDYDPPAAPVLLDLKVKGKRIKAVAQVTKEGFCFVFDRVSGKPVWPIEERPAPPSHTEGERASPTQPVPTLPAPFERQGLSEDDLIDFTPELRQQAMEIASKFDYGPLYTPATEKGVILLPGLYGGADWVGAVAHPGKGVLYVPSHTLPSVAWLSRAEPNASSAYVATINNRLSGPEGLPLTKPPYGRITAIDLNTGEHRWMRPMGRGPVDHPALRALQLPPLGWDNRTFALATSTLLLTASQDPRDLGNAGEGYFVDREAYLQALDLDTGEPVGQVELPGNAYASPITYMAGKRQYIAVSLGDGFRPSELVALALPRKGEALPPQGLERGDADHPAFYQAVAALDAGDLEGLKGLLQKNPGLAKAQGYLDEYYEYASLRGATLLHLTAGNPNRVALPPNPLALAAALLEAGADANAATLDTVTALGLVIDSAQLKWAQRQGEFIELLLKAGADANANQGKILWMALTGEEQQEAAKALVAGGARVDLRFAAGVNRLDLMAAFFGPDHHLTPEAGSLYRPAAGTDPQHSEQDILDEALGYASYGGAAEAVVFLLERGAHIDAQPPHFWPGDRGCTALHKAVSGRHAEILRLLLEKGADPRIEDQQYHATPRGWAEYFGQGELAQILREAEEKRAASSK